MEIAGKVASALWHGRKHAAPGYDTAKAGVIRLTTMLAWLGEEERIRVNCLAPGWIASEQVAEAVVLLAADETLSGRVMVWWSEDTPGLIPWGDRGYAALAARAIP